MRQKTSNLGTTTLLILAFVVSLPHVSHADAIYDAAAVVDLTVTGFKNGDGPLLSKPDDLTIIGEAFVIDADADTEGDAFADRVAGANVFGTESNTLTSIGDKLAQQAITTGHASLGTAASFVLTEGNLFIENISSTESYSIDFDAHFLYIVEASASIPNLKFAAAAIEILLESTSHGVLLDVSQTSETDLGGGLFLTNDVLPFSVSLLPGESELLSLTVNAAGVAEAVAEATVVTPIPEPSTFILFGIGLLGLASTQWRMRILQHRPVNPIHECS